MRTLSFPWQRKEARAVLCTRNKRTSGIALIPKGPRAFSDPLVRTFPHFLWKFAQSARQMSFFCNHMAAISSGPNIALQNQLFEP